jgi:hypothetical protein
MIVLFFLLGGVSDVGKKTKKQNKTLIPWEKRTLKWKI